jgi:hypothetical protein
LRKHPLDRARLVRAHVPPLRPVSYGFLSF